VSIKAVMRETSKKADTMKRLFLRAKGGSTHFGCHQSTKQQSTTVGPPRDDSGGGPEGIIGGNFDYFGWRARPGGKNWARLGKKASSGGYDDKTDEEQQF
jgi:hypothetical protein